MLHAGEGTAAPPFSVFWEEGLRPSQFLKRKALGIRFLVRGLMMWFL